MAGPHMDARGVDEFGAAGLTGRLRPPRRHQAPASERCSVSGDRDTPAVLADALEDDPAALEGEKSVVTAFADAPPGHDVRPSLPDDDGAGIHGLAAGCLDAEHLGVGVAAVAGRAAAFL